MGKWLKYGGLALLTLIVLGAIGNSSDDPSTTAPSVDSNDEDIYSLNESVPVGELGVLAKKIDTRDVVGGTYTSTEADGVFLLFAVTVKNGGDESVMLSSSNFELVDSQGRTFSVSTEATTSLSMENYKTFQFDEINPGLQTTGVVVFDVPPSAEGLKMKVNSGVFGDSSLIRVGDASNF